MTQNLKLRRFEVEILSPDPTGKLSQNPFRFSACVVRFVPELPAEFAVSAARVSASSNRVDGLLFFALIADGAVRWQSGRRVASSKAAMK
jgi:hypothetical protein